MFRFQPISAIVLAICFVLVLAACGSDNQAAESAGGDSTSVASAEGSMKSDAENFGQTEDQKNSEDEEKKKKKEKSTSVDAGVAFTGDLVKPVIAEGTIRARHSAEIRAEISGKITRVYAEEGQQLRKGQMIAKIDDREYQVAAEEARATYLQTLSLLAIEEDDLDVQAIAKEVRDEFANLEQMERRGEITPEERLAREIKLDVESLKEGKFRVEIAAARSGVSQARAALERARLDLERTEIRAPFDGVITELVFSSGEQVTPSEVICSIVDNVNIEAEVGVLEADLGYVSEGKPALLAVPALNETLQVQVDVVSPQFDRESRTCQVLIRLADDTGRIRPGMFVRALIAGQTFFDRLLVPREAILTRDDRPLLFKVEGDRAKWLYVRLGESNDDLIEITKVLQGGQLAPGDKVIVSDHLTLTHEAKVKVKKTLPVSDPWIAFSRAEK
ncbi:MAG: efflux RND transporter periplasmic adaptor subunit [Candidatus Latescibacterota bacterium]